MNRYLVIDVGVNLPMNGNLKLLPEKELNIVIGKVEEVLKQIKEIEKLNNDASVADDDIGHITMA